MMLYAVHDKAVNAFLPPFACRARGEAMRSFVDACTDVRHAFNKHADDYVLYELAAFDEGSGLIYPHDDPRRVMSGLEAAAIVVKE